MPAPRVGDGSHPPDTPEKQRRPEANPFGDHRRNQAAGAPLHLDRSASRGERTRALREPGNIDPRSRFVGESKGRGIRGISRLGRVLTLFEGDLVARMPRSKHTFPALSLAAGLLGSLTFAVQALGATPIGSEFQVNTYTTSAQRYPSVAVEADGDFVVVWHSLRSADTDTSSFSIQGQRYDASGNVAGAQFQVNTYTTSFQRRPSVAVDADGDFVVVWHSYGSADTDTHFFSIQGQRYDASGNVVGTEFQVNTYTTSYQLRPSVAVDADGDFVVVWHSLRSADTDTDGYSIQGQRYDGCSASDLDADGVGDLCDPCPSDATNTCDTERSTSETVGTGGGTVTTPDESVTLDTRPARSTGTPSLPSRTQDRGPRSSSPPSWASARPPTW